MKRIWAIPLSVVFFVITGILLFSSCNKDAGDSGKGNILFVQASPDAPAVDIRNVSVVGTAFSSENITGATGISYTSGTPNSAYINMNTSTYTLGIYSSGASATIAPTVLSMNNFVVTSDVNNSVFIINRLSSIMVSVVTDDLTPPVPGNSGIRFFNLSPDAPNLNVFMVSNTLSPAPTTIPAATTAKFANRSFNDQNGNTANTGFISVPTGYYRIEIRNTTGATLTALTQTNLLLDDGRIYTIYVRGFVTPPTGNSNVLSAKVLTNY
jgi:hypothetical protein